MVEIFFEKPTREQLQCKTCGRKLKKIGKSGCYYCLKCEKSFDRKLSLKLRLAMWLYRYGILKDGE